MSSLWRKQWRVCPTAPQQLLDCLPELHPLVAQVLYNRHLTGPEEITAFLEGTLVSDNPFLLADMNRAVTLIRQAVTDRAPIAVYGDYDVDGITATAIMVQTLRSLGADARPYIPDRFEEGYGLNADAIQALAKEGVRLMITVDCGIRSPNEVAVARSCGMQVVVTDHHHISGPLPEAEAAINPKRQDSKYPFRDLAGSGVAYKLAQALLRVNSKTPLRTTVSELSEAELLDLVALGTVADMVPLLGENHVLVRQGLEQLNAARRPGMAALMQTSGAKPGGLTPSTIGYTLGPRLNAAGRMGDSMVAFDLLMAQDFSTALDLAQKLEQINDQRREDTLKIQEDARKSLGVELDRIGEADAEIKETASEPVQAGGPPLLFAASQDFHVGIIGLVAGRLAEEFYRPAIVVQIDEPFSKGSARSIPEFHITQALDAVADLLVRYGGHEAAAGFTVRTEYLDTLRERLMALAKEQLIGVNLAPSLEADAEVPLEQLSYDLYHELETLTPFGYKNPMPLFIARRVHVLRAVAVGSDGRHLKLSVVGEDGVVWDAIAFRQGDWFGRLPPLVDLAYHLQQNEWNGKVNLQLNVEDIHPVN